MNNKSKWDSLSLKEKSEIMKLAISSGVMDLDNIRNSYNSFAEGGPTEKPTFEEYYQSLPKDKRDTVNYNLRRAYELYPYEYMVKFAEDPNYHLGTVAYNENTDEYEFLKGKNHNTVQKEIEWYYSNDSDAIEHRKNWKLDTSGDTYKYIRKNKFYTGGPTEYPMMEDVNPRFTPQYMPPEEEKYVPATAAGFIAKITGADEKTQAAADIGSAVANLGADNIPIIGNIVGIGISALDTVYDLGKLIYDPSWKNLGDLGTSALSMLPYSSVKEIKTMTNALKYTGGAKKEVIKTAIGMGANIIDTTEDITNATKEIKKK